MNSSPTRRSLLGAFVGGSMSGLSGCTGDLTTFGGDSPSLSEEFDCEYAERPAPNDHGGEQHVDPLSYPDPPDVSDDFAVRQFVKDHEEAYVRNETIDRYGADLRKHRFNVGDMKILGRDGSVAFVSLYYGTTTETDDSIGGDLSGGFGSGVTYAVDNFGAARADAGVGTDDRQVTGGIPSEDSESHPIEYGRLVACFDT